MATYKVLQDIEAEDKLVGPFSLRQFIYAAIAAISGFLAFKLASVNLLLIAPFVPVIVLFAVLAVPFGHDQPNEVWLLARVRFFLKPHRRIWNQTGMVDLVTVTAPKNIQKSLTKNLSQTEARSRLRALADTIDSRGWAIKNVNVNLSNQLSQSQIPTYSDRLIDPSSLPQDVPSYDVSAADDMLDPISNPTAQHLNQMIEDSSSKHHKQVVDKLNSASPQTVDNQPADYWFMNDASGQATQQQGYDSFNNPQVILPGDDSALPRQATQPDDVNLLDQIKRNKDKEHENHSRMAHLDPAKTPAGDKQGLASTDPAIINLALANKDNWSVATQAHQAEAAKKKEPPQDEVTISLH